MIIAVSASGPTLDAQVDPRFGRAAFFVVVDTASGEFQAYPNTQNYGAAQGAGIQAAETVSRLGASVVITGNCGPKAFKTLGAAGITVVTDAEGTVESAIHAYKRGDLTPANEANVEGHWA